MKVVDGHRRSDRLRAAGLGDDVEVLPAQHLGADIGPDPLDPPLSFRRQVHAENDVVRPGQREITEQDGCRYPEPLRRAPPLPVAVQRREVDMSGRPAAAGGGIVDHIVMHQRAGVQQLQRGKEQQHFRIRIPGRHGAPAPIGEGGPQPLPPVEHKILEGGDQNPVVAT